MTQRIQEGPASRSLADLSASPDVDPHQFVATLSNAGGGVVRLALSGDIDLAVRERVRQIVETRLVDEGVKALLIDLSAVTFMDCGGIGVLVAGRHLAADTGRGYRVVNASGIAARVLDLTGVWPVLELSLVGAEGVTPGWPQRP